MSCVHLWFDDLEKQALGFGALPATSVDLNHPFDLSGHCHVHLPVSTRNANTHMHAPLPLTVLSSSYHGRERLLSGKTCQV